MSGISGISGISGYKSYNSYNYGRLASGKRIMTAADDAAGLAIATKQESQVRTAQVQINNKASERNALNVTDGAKSGITDYLHQIRDLAVQASNGTNSASDKKAIQDQIDQLKQGINDVTTQTRYNENYLMRDGGTSTEALGIADFSVMGDEIDLDAIDSALQAVSSSRSSDGAGVNGLEHAMNSLSNEAYNTMAGLSQNADLDYGKAVTEQKKQQVLDQYQTSMQRKFMEDQQNLAARMFS